MNGIVMAGQLILSLSILVLIHEFGHYIACRIFKIRVTKFFIFFDAGFKIWSKKIGETEYGIGWLPLGGYVKIAGMIDESLDTKQMKEEPKEWEFRSKPAWQRLIVMLAGVFMNVVAAIIILTFSHLIYTKDYLPVDNVKEGIYAYPYAREIGFQSGDKIRKINKKDVLRYEDVFSFDLYFAKTVTVERNGSLVEIQMPENLYSYLKKGDEFIALHNFAFKVDSLVNGMPAQLAGIKPGAKILEINSQPVSSFGAFREILMQNKNQELKFIVDNSGKIDTLKIQVDSLGKIGVYTPIPKYEMKNYNLITAFKYGWKDAFTSLTANLKGFSLIFKGQEKASESLQGPIGIAKVYGPVWDWAKFWRLTGIISMILAFMNLLPIPALDGGHALFTVFELITGKKLPDKFMEVVQVIGMVILLLLMVFVIGNDIIKLFK